MLTKIAILQRDTFMLNHFKYCLHLCLIFCIASLVACTTYGELLIGHPTKNSPALVEKHTSAKVIFFNEAHIDSDSSHTNATVISTQGKLISGLHPQQYIITRTCDGTQSYQVTRGGDGPVTTIELTATPNSVHHVRLTPSTTSSEISYNISKHDQVGDVIKNYDDRSFLVARYFPNCKTPTEPPEPTMLNFDAKVLFTSNSSEISDILLKPPLEKVVRFIETNATQPMHVIVSGYTDNLGKPDYNQKLSEERAQTIASYLKNKGFNGHIQVLGFGSEDPIVTNCLSSLARDELIKCMQPNRRVTIRIRQAD